MNRKMLLALIIVVVILLTAFTASQNYEIDWWSVNGGAGKSLSDGFALSGIIGQPDAGKEMSGGDFTVVGGYWNTKLAVGSPAKQTLLLPLLMSRTEN